LIKNLALLSFILLTSWFSGWSASSSSRGGR